MYNGMLIQNLDIADVSSERRNPILANVMAQSMPLPTHKMSETLSVSQRTIERDLSALQKHGVLKREGKDNDGVWVIVKNNVN